MPFFHEVKYAINIHTDALIYHPLSSSLLPPPPFLFFSRSIVKELQRPVEHALALIGYLNFQFEKEVAILEGNSAGAGTADEVRVVQCAVCSVQCAVCSVQCAACSVR